LANIHSVITYNANLSPAQAQIKALTGQIAGLTAAFNTLDKSALSAQRSLASTFATNVGQIGGFTAKTVQAQSAVEGFGKALASNRLTMRQYFREAFAGYTRQNSMLKELAIQQVRYQQSIAVSTAAGQAMMITPAQVNSLTSSTAIASQKFSIFNKLIEGGSTSLLNFGKNTQWAGRQLMVGFTIPLALFTAAVSKQFRDLDKELTRFQKVYGQDLGSSMKNSTEAMRKQVEELAFSIGRNYGIAATETAALAADIAATGAEGEKLIKSVQETTRLAVLGEVDRQEAMKATLAIQSAFKMDTDELTQSINFLNAVENQTSTTLQDFATAIPRVGPVVQSLGGDIQDLAMMLVAMREGGVPAAEAANAIKSGLASMINPTQKASDVAKEFGINLNKIVEDNKGQLMPTIYAMQNALQGLDDFGRARIIEEIFGKYQFARMSALFENLGRMGSQTQSVLELTANSSVELAAIANAELKTLQESTAMKFQRTLEQLRNTLIPIGETLTESLIPIFQFIGQAAGKFIEFFQALPEPIKNFAKYGTAIAALAGPVIMLVGLFGNLIANGIKFGMMMVRLGARIAGLRVEKFELLNEEVMAARLGVDTLTGSFTTQERALRQLIGAMSSYGASLRTLQTTNPALFIPGAAGRGTAPIKRQAGSKNPEYVPGSGSGDKIPALLEPGEFIVNRKAASSFGPLLSAMNSGKVGKYQTGGLVKAHIAAPGRVNLQDEKTMAMFRAIASPYAMGLIDAMAAAGVKQMNVYSNLVLMLTQSTNRLLTDSAAREKLNDLEIAQHNQSLKTQFQSQQAWQLMMDQTGLSFAELQPVIDQIIVELNALGKEVIDDPMMYAAVEEALRKLANTSNKAALTLQTVSGQYGAFQTMSVGPEGTRGGRRQAFGATTAGIPGYTDLKPGRIPRTYLQDRTMTVDPTPFFVTGMGKGAADATRSSSPSKEAEAVGEATGRNVGRGVISGLSRGLDRSTSGEAGGPGGSRLNAASNASFAAMMAASSLTLVTGASSDAAAKIGLFTTALMTATTAMQIFGGSNVLGNFLGLGSLGEKLKAAGAARAAASIGLKAPMAPLSMGVGKAAGAGAAMKMPGGLAGAGSGLARGGAMLSMLGGPVGIAAGLGITAAITGFMLYKKAAEEARERAIAAFADPVKTAEYFGENIKSVTQQFSDMAASSKEAGLNAGEVDQGLREAVKQDYAPLIENIQRQGSEVGARELSNAFNKMIASGLSAEQATASVEAIAVEAGVKGGQAFATAMGQGMLEATSTLDAMLSFRSSAAGGEQAQAAIERITVSGEERRRNVVSPGTTRGYGRSAIAFGSSDYVRDAARIGDLATTSSDELIKAAEFYFQTFTEAPQEAIKYFDQIAATTDETFNVDQIEEYLKGIDEVAGSRLASMIDENADKAKQVLRALSAGMSLPEIIAAIEAGTLDAEIKIRVDTRQAEINIQNLKDSISEALGADLTKNLEATDDNIEGLDKQINRVQNSLEKGTEKLQENFEATQEASDAAIEAMQDEADLIQEKIDKRREETQEKIDSLNEEKDGIVEATDAYIKSIQKRQRVDSFYANQRKTAFSALQKLASGDVFGFLQARTEMGQEAQQFSYDNQIQSIEDRREKEVNAIEDTIEKEQERQEQFEKNQQEKIDLINDQMDAERDLQDERQKGFEAQLEEFKKIKEKRVEDLQDARAKEQVKREGIQKAIDAAEAQQIISAKDLAKVLGPELAAPYIEEQKALIRTMYLADIKNKISAEEALKNAKERLMTLYPEQDRTQTGINYNAATIAELLGMRPGTSPIPNRANGGPISGPGGPKSDVIPAMLSNGEYVVQASSVKKYGTGLMDAINTQKFAEGGLIEGGQNTAERGSFNFASPKLVEGRIFPNKNKPKPDPGTGTGSPPPGGVTTNPPVAPGMDNILSLAQKYSYLPYSSAYPIQTDKSGNPTGWGCATSVAWLYKNGAGITLPSPSLSYGQYAGLRQTVSRSNIAPGDLIFYYNSSGVNTQNPVNHVEMYMGAGKVFNGGVGIQGGFSNHPVVSIKRPSKFAAGGFVGGMGGPRSDTVPALLSSGEYVMKSNAVDKYGRGFMDQINSGNFNMPSFGMPSMPTAPSSSIATTVNGGTSSTNNSSSNVKIVINGVSGKSATAIANKVASMINSSNNRRNHSRSI